MIEYPKNIKDWFINVHDEEFSMWAFGCKQPRLNGGVQKCWEKLHPEYPMIAGEMNFICICKMNYLYQQQKSFTPPSDTMI
jgi:hypothetical protein